MLPTTNLPVTGVRLQPKTREKLFQMSKRSGMPISRVIDLLIESAVSIEIFQTVAVEFEQEQTNNV